MGTHTNIYFSDKNQSLYFKYCYPDHIGIAAKGNFKEELERLYFEDNKEKAEYCNGNALFEDDFPHDYYFEYDGNKIFQIIETNLQNQFVRIELDNDYNDLIAKKLKDFFRKENGLELRIMDWNPKSKFGFCIQGKWFSFDKDLNCLTENHGLDDTKIEELKNLATHCLTKRIVSEHKLSQIIF